MLKKTNFNDPGTPAIKESSPTIIKSNVTGAEESRVSIAAKNEDIPRVRPKSVSVFGSTLTFRGELSADEEIIIQGTVEGTIAHHKKNVTIGKQGRVFALIHANSVTIEGRVDGDIHGDEFVVMTEGAEVNGNIYCPRIRMEDGAKFNGTIQMS
jgi:cytoskeletal protein CcmA (bactofilin family)